MRLRDAEPSVATGRSVAHYTLCGDPAAEARVDQDLSRLGTGIDAEVGEALRALILVGPFARGEGAIRMRAAEPSAAGDGYQLLALVKHAHRRHARALTTMAATWGRLLHARVAIYPIAERELGRAPATRFWFHTGRGQAITLAGNPMLTRAVPVREPVELRWDEPLLTLCEELLPLSLCSLEAAPTPELAVESMQRAVLACGDAALLHQGRYAETLSARAQAIGTAHAGAALTAGYREAIEWCSRPDLWSPRNSDMDDWLESTRSSLATCYLDLEARRIGSARDLLAYLRHPAPLYVPAARSLARSAWALRHARRDSAADRLLRCCIALSFAPHAPAARAQVASLLRVPSAEHQAPEPPRLAGALRALAHRVFLDDLGHPFAGTISRAVL
jgi:hypothetical protein